MPSLPLPESQNAEAARWVARRRAGACSPDEQRAFLRWLNASEANRLAYREADELWQQLGGLETIAGRRLHEAREHLAQSRQRTLRRRVAGAAVAVVLAAVVWQADWLSYLNDQTFRTALGERKSVTLADGSRLDLNTDSEVTVHYSRKGRELVVNRGQAAFEVAHGDTRPFDVVAGSIQVRDIGTRFDVRRSAEKIEISVLEGEVGISGRDGAAQPARQGRRFSYSAAGDAMATEAIDVATAGAWRDGRIVFKSQPFGSVLAELGRYHLASVAVSSPRLLNVKISGAIPADNLEVALTTLAATLPATLTRTGAQSWRIDG